MVNPKPPQLPKLPPKDPHSILYELLAKRDNLIKLREKLSQI